MIGVSPIAERAKQLLRSPAQTFEGAFILFVAAAFILRPTPVWADIFYVALFPAFVRALWTRERTVPRAPETWLLLALLVYFGASILWTAVSAPGRNVKFAFGVLTNGLFIAAAITFFARADERILDRFGRVFLAAAVANAVISLTLFVIQGDLDERLRGWAETRHPILGGLIITLALIFALDRFRRAQAFDWRALAISALFVCFVALTRSRTAIIAASCVTIIAAWRLPARRAAILAILLALPGLLAFAAEPSLVESAFAQLVERSDSHRLFIWTVAWENIQLRPLLGHGLATIFPLAEPFGHPHNLFLSTLFYGGLIGFTLLLALALALGVRVLALAGHERRMLALCLLAYLTASTAFDYGPLFRGASELWLTLWLPVAMIIGYAVRTAKGRPDLTTAPSAA